MSPRVALAWVALLAIGCVRVAPEAGGGTPALQLDVADWNGAPASARALPRRPRLSLRGPIAADDQAWFLLRGSADDDLRSSLERKPLRAEYLARALPLELRAAAGGLVLTPRTALDADASYVLAGAAWARATDGSSLGTAVPAVFALHTDRGDGAGARVIGSWPADGAVDVGTNLEAVVVAFDGTAQHAAEGVWLQDPAGLSAPAQAETGPCAELAPAHRGQQCVRLTPAQLLAPDAAYAIVVGREARDMHGAPIGPFEAEFRTAAGPDRQPPSPLRSTCAIDELALDVGCALVDDTSVSLRVLADEPVTAELRAADAAETRAAPDAEVVLRLSGLAADADVAANLVLRDAAGNQRESPIALHTLLPLPSLSIVEVRADPLGPEPQQELVELLNYGPRAADLLGFSLDLRTDARATPIARSFLVAPQTRVLMVPDDFDPNDPRDAPVPPGAPLLRMGRALGGSGLSNAGTRVFLRDPAGHRVSAAPSTPPPRAGVCSVRTGAEMRDGAPGTFAYDPDDTCTPGR